MSWRDLRRGAPALLFIALGVFCVGRAAIYPDRAATLVSGGLSSLIIGIGVWREARWARWLALGLTLAALGNGASAIALGRGVHPSSIGSFYIITIAIAAGAAIVGVLLLGRRSRDQFEPGWSSPALVAIRVAAVFIASIGPVLAIDVVAWRTGHPGSISALVLLFGGFVLLAADRIAGLPVALAGLLVFASYDLRAFYLAPESIMWSVRWSADWTEGSFLFYGPFSRFAWIPALLSLFVATALIVRARVQRPPVRPAKI